MKKYYLMAIEKDNSDAIYQLGKYYKEQKNIHMKQNYKNQI